MVLRLHTVSSVRRASASPDVAPHLVARIASGDQDAMADLYDATRSVVYGLVLRIVGEPELADEVTIEVYAQAWRQASRFDPQRGAALAWLLNISRSRALDAVRARGRRIPLADEQSQLRDRSSQEPGPAEMALASERCRAVRAALAELAPEQREAIELAFFSELSHIEVAERLAAPLGTVKTRIRSGMIKLRAVLDAVDRSEGQLKRA